jgi:hypothetical protein
VNGCESHADLIGGYVLGALDSSEDAAMRRHLEECEHCRREYEALAGIPALLDRIVPADVPPPEPSPALEEAVLDRFAREHRAARTISGSEPARRPRRRLAALLRPLRRPLPAAAAGALTAAAVAAAIALLPADDDAHGSVYGAKLEGSAAAPGAHAYARLETSNTGTRVRLHVHGLRGDPANRYELWCVEDDGDKISAGTFRVDARGDATVSLTTAAVPGEYHKMSVERKTASAAAGERVMTGSIQY